LVVNFVREGHDVVGPTPARFPGRRSPAPVDTATSGPPEPPARPTRSSVSRHLPPRRLNRRSPFHASANEGPRCRASTLEPLRRICRAAGVASARRAPKEPPLRRFPPPS